MRNRLVLFAAVLVLIGAALEFTKPGRTLLAQFGLATACTSSDCGD